MPIIDKEHCMNLLSANELKVDEKDMQRSSSGNKAYEKILRLVGVRDRSVKELRDRLLREGFKEDATEEALERALQCGLLDDIRFGEILIVSRKNAGKGKSGIEYDLEKNEIDATLIPGWPEEYFPNDESEVEEAVAFLFKRPPTAKNKRDAAYRKLISRGYSSAIASRAVRTWIESFK